MAQDWFVVRDGKETGPFTSHQLKEMAATDKLVPDDLVRRSDMKDAIKAGALKGFFQQRPAHHSTQATASPPPPNAILVSPSTLTASQAPIPPQQAKGFLQKMKMAWQGLRVRAKIVIGVGCAFMLFVPILCGGCLVVGLKWNHEEEGNIKMVKDQHVDAHPQYAVGDVLDAVCDGPHWRYFRAEKEADYIDPEQVVEFTGNTKRGKVLIQWIVRGKKNIEFGAAELEGRKMSMFETASFFDAAFAEYDKKHGSH